MGKALSGELSCPCDRSCSTKQLQLSIGIVSDALIVIKTSFQKVLCPSLLLHLSPVYCLEPLYFSSEVFGLVDRVFAVQAGSREFDSHQWHMSE